MVQIIAIIYCLLMVLLICVRAGVRDADLDFHGGEFARACGMASVEANMKWLSIFYVIGNALVFILFPT